MRSELFLSTAVALMLALPAHVLAQQPAQQPQSQMQAQTQQGQVPQQAMQFAEKAAISGMYEIQSSELALENAQDLQPVAQFAQRMIDDHGAANAQLKQIAQQLGIQLPATLDAEHQRKVEQLQGMSGQEFAQQYAQQQIQGHEQAIQDFESYAQQGQVQELRTFAQENLPLLQEHLRMAQDMQQQIQGVASAGQTGQNAEIVVVTPEPAEQQQAEASLPEPEQQAELGQGAEVATLGGVRLDDLMGREVVGSDGEELGTIEDIVLDPQSGQAQRAIIASGGFLGMGEKRIAVSFDELQVGQDRIVAERLTQASVEGLEEFEYDDNMVSLGRPGIDAGDANRAEPLVIQEEGATRNPSQ